MKYLLRLLIPLGLGAVAALLNLYMVTAQTESVVFLTVDKPMDQNEMFDLTHAKELPLPQKYGELLKSVVPFSDRGIVSGRVARRTIQPGDPVFYADFDLDGQWLSLGPGEELFPIELKDFSVDSKLLRIGNNIHFRVPNESEDEEPLWIGPYRIVAVGGKINNNFDDDKRSISGTFSIGVAYNKERDALLIKQLESFCDRQVLGAKILAVRIQDTRK
jgi:hypothetical protein